MANELNISVKDFEILAEKLGIAHATIQNRVLLWESENLQLFQWSIKDFDIKTLDQEVKEAFEQGKADFGNHKPIKRNPYKRVDQFKAWCDGWWEARNKAMGTHQILKTKSYAKAKI